MNNTIITTVFEPPVVGKIWGIIPMEARILCSTILQTAYTSKKII